MRILIQDPVNKNYFGEDGWDDDILNASDFESVAQAEKFCLDNGLENSLIVVKFRDAAHDISYPVGARNVLIARSFTKKTPAHH